MASFITRRVPTLLNKMGWPNVRIATWLRRLVPFSFTTMFPTSFGRMPFLPHATSLTACPPPSYMTHLPTPFSSQTVPCSLFLHVSSVRLALSMSCLRGMINCMPSQPRACSWVTLASNGVTGVTSLIPVAMLSPRTSPSSNWLTTLTGRYQYGRGITQYMYHNTPPQVGA